jgi:CHAT domain-containing protein
MEPIRRKLLAGNSHVLISPDGELNIVPFEALVDENGKHLIERFKFNYLTSGRDLLEWNNDTAAKAGPVIVANPDYGEPDAGHARVFPPLPGTKLEGDELSRLLHLKPDDVLEDKRATKAAVFKLESPVVLHIATHGFFFESEPPEAPSSQRSVLADSYLQGSRLGVVDRADNPLLRAGLGLAGANHYSSSDDSGVLTALEVSGLDLFGTRLVVLSACDTGLGERTNGNGLYGLRRALVLAGSRSQVLSLWTVDDLVTRDLMVQFYKRLLAGEGKADALASAKMEVFRSHPHPYFWAPFTFSGDNKPLDWRPSR